MRNAYTHTHTHTKHMCVTITPPPPQPQPDRSARNEEPGRRDGGTTTSCRAWSSTRPGRARCSLHRSQGARASWSPARRRPEKCTVAASRSSVPVWPGERVHRGPAHGRRVDLRCPHHETAAAQDPRRCRPGGLSGGRGQPRFGRRELAALLKIWGDKVHIVHDGFAVLESRAGLRSRRGVADLGLPGLNGFEVAERLRSRPCSRCRCSWPSAAMDRTKTGAAAMTPVSTII